MATFYVIRYHSRVTATVAYNSNYYKDNDYLVFDVNTYQGDGPGVPFEKVKFFKSPTPAKSFLKRSGWDKFADVIPIEVQEPL